MAVRPDLIEALNDCIDRLRAGEDTESALSDYPALASQLRPMLQAGFLVSRARYPAVDVQAAEQAIEPIVRESIRQSFGGGLFGWWWILLLLGLGSVAAILLTIQGGVDLIGAGTETPTSSPTASPTVTMTATATSAPTPTSPAQPTATELVEALLIIEGPVSLVTEDMIVIYDTALSPQPSSPLLDVIQVGDMLRVEARPVPDTDIVQVVNITFVNITVVVRDDLAWRDDDCVSPPPEWARDAAGDWFARCAPSAPGGGRPSADDDDDDDDDDD
jgi:hypothetical protein